MEDNVLTRVGPRGGAGNYRSKKDVEQAEEQQRDLEAQKLSTPVVRLEPDFVRTGRGGFGNYVPPIELSTESKDMARGSKEGITQPRKARDKPSGAGYSGRGGAGNWTRTDQEEERKKAEEEAKIQIQVNERVRIDVEAMMKPPPKAHAAPQANWGKHV